MANKGRCAICGALGKLTEDHVPPQAAVPPNPILVRRFAVAAGLEGDSSIARPGHAAPKFRTICADCNNVQLGNRFDPALVAFATEFSAWVRCAFQLHLTLPAAATVTFQPALVARAVIGHLLAAEPGRVPRHQRLDGAMPALMREYFLSEALALPSALRLYVWPYPSTRIVLGRGIGYYDLRRGGPIIADVLKFFPLAFAVVSAINGIPSISAVQIRPELAASIEDRTRIEIPLTGAPGLTWPELPQEMSLVLSNLDRVMAVDRAPRNAP